MINPPASTGLNAVYVVPASEGISAEISGTSSNAEWYIFDSRGAAFAELLTDHETLSADKGYIIEDSGSKFYFWITDWSKAPFIAGNLEIETSDCSSTELIFTGEAQRLSYQTITGRTMEIDREIILSYFTLEQNGETAAFNQIIQTRSLPFINERISLPSPLCSTRFILTGDRFLQEWNQEIEIQSGILTPTAVSAAVSVEQLQRDALNEQKNGDSSFGGSAPVDMIFRAAVSDAVVFTEWQISTDPEFINIILRERSPEWDYTFNESGTYYVRFMCANASGECDWFSDNYMVSIGESRLRCPNAFSPGASEGVNDEWKVSYKSIISFECHIFNRLGVKMAELHDPSQGWNGKYKGSFVKPGVYYYVIKALGADGKKYNLSGDINIVGSRSR
ncbi:MAG: gliding motility-associated C-terminal domain-containing protein [Paramuribaculum sp.]|nr:gliding motility-associated C-terminal domain-containing protein [Paramuribaculum sp.]